MAGNVDGGNEADPNLTPLLDVVLQLIMFFMITVNFVRVEHLTDKVVLPVAQSALPQDDASEDWVYLNVGADGKPFVTGEDLSTSQKLRVYLLRRKEEIENLAAFRGIKSDKLRITVIVSAHEEARAQQVWDVLNTGKQAEFKRWKIRAMTRKS